MSDILFSVLPTSQDAETAVTVFVQHREIEVIIFAMNAIIYCVVVTTSRFLNSARCLTV